MIDLSITPRINEIDNILVETNTTIDKLRATITEYENTFYKDTEVILQAVK